MSGDRTCYLRGSSAGYPNNYRILNIHSDLCSSEYRHSSNKVSTNIVLFRLIYFSYMQCEQHVQTNSKQKKKNLLVTNTDKKEFSELKLDHQFRSYSPSKSVNLKPFPSDCIPQYFLYLISDFSLYELQFLKTMKKKNHSQITNKNGKPQKNIF